jgi:hypothetical protein
LGPPGPRRLYGDYGPGGAGYDAGYYGQILDLESSAAPPMLDRVRPLRGEIPMPAERRPLRREWAGEWYWDGAIFDDRLDGRRVYPRPPRRSRAVDRIGRLMDRLTPATSFFILLAWLQVSIAITDIWSSGDWSPGSVLVRLSHLAYMACLTLLPAGVLVWRPDAWRSAGLVLAGAIVWTTLPSLAGVVWWLVLRSPLLTAEYGNACAVVLAVTVITACLGPVLIAFGLQRVRREPAPWLRAVAEQATVVAGVLTLVLAARWLPLVDSRQAGLPGGGLDTVHLADSVAGTVEPLALMGLFLLACSSLAAIQGDESQRRLWQGVAAGSTILAGVTLFELSSGDLLTGVATWSPADRGTSGLEMAGSLLAGAASILLAFTSPIWSSAEDALGTGRGAPDEIFAWGAGSSAGNGEPIPIGAVVAVAAGSDHALALDDAGHVGAWGDDSLGQTDVPEDLGEVVAIAAGDGFSLALRTDGTVAAWGADDLGQTDVPADLSGVTAIAAGRGFAVALRGDGTVTAWGETGSGVVPAPPDLVGVVAISAGESHALALRLDGSVVAWGDDRCGQSSVPARLGRARSISAGGDFSLALLADGTVAAWGDGRYGQLDLPAGLRKVVAISAGAFHALALLEDGDVVGWGGGDRMDGEAAHPWHLVDFKAVAAGDGFSLAIRAA